MLVLLSYRMQINWLVSIWGQHWHLMGQCNISVQCVTLPTAKNNLFVLSGFSFTETDNLQDSRRREGDLLSIYLTLPAAHKKSNIYFQLCTCDDFQIFLIATHACNYHAATWWDLTIFGNQHLLQCWLLGHQINVVIKLNRAHAMLSKTKHYVDLKPIKSIYHAIFESNLDWT